MHAIEPTLTIRDSVSAADVEVVRRLTAATGYFSAHEVEVAVELIEDRVARGDASDYHFVFAGVGGEPAGYASFGPIACTECSFDLYWIVVHPAWQSRGVGRRLLEEVERVIKSAGGRRVYVETSSREQYLPTRRFYLGCGYRIDADQADFYAPGDGKITYVKPLDESAASHG